MQPNGMTWGHFGDVGASPTYVDSLFHALATDPGRVVLIDADTGTSVTASELVAVIAGFTEALRVAGVGLGDLVAIVAPITMEALAVRYAAGALGCATVYCPGALEPDRVSDFLDNISAEAVIVFPETAHAAAAPVPGRFLSVGPVPGAADLRMIADGLEVPRPLRAPVHDTGLCTLVASGGTTGNSKASRRDWRSYTRLVDRGPAPGRRQLICTPLAYIAQIVADTVLIGGGVVVLHTSFEPAQILQTLQEERITHLAVVEPLLVQLLGCERLPATDLSSVVAISHVGADAAPSLRARLLERLGRPVLVNAYGVSECGLISALGPPDYSQEHPELLGSSGRLLPGVELRIVDGRGNDCSTGELGSILVRSPHQAQGYGLVEASPAFLHDGWFDTRDVGLVDVQGHLHVRGREADRRIVNGETVFPGDIQEVFCAIPEVQYAVAIPAPTLDEGFGVALIVAKTATSRAADLVEYVRTYGGEHLVPSAAAVIAAIPTTEQGKPDRAALIEILWGESSKHCQLHG